LTAVVLISARERLPVECSVLRQASLLMDTGILNAVLPLIGDRNRRPALIADYLASLRQLVQWMYLAIAPAANIARETDYA
jgi:hypothetical protein